MYLLDPAQAERWVEGVLTGLVAVTCESSQMSALSDGGEVSELADPASFVVFLPVVVANPAPPYWFDSY